MDDWISFSLVPYLCKFMDIMMFYRQGEWYTEKNECFIYLFSTKIRC